MAKTEDVNDKKRQGRREKKKKRGLFQLGDGSILDDGYSISQGLDDDYSGVTGFGLVKGANEEEDEREPAEAEVRQVMDLCDGCTEEPFGKALVIDWRSVPKKLYSGALYMPAVPACKAF